MKTLAYRQVSLTHFKNYSGAEFLFGPRFNLISGLNGTGKTSLLDALYYLSVGKSFFTPYDQRVVQQEADFFRLTAQLIRGEEEHSFVLKVRPGKEKEMQVDSYPLAKISDHLGYVPVVFSAPRDIELVTGSGQTRRRYFDHLLCQIDPDYLKALVQYNYLLQLRIAALKNGFGDLRRVVETYDMQMDPLAAKIFEARHRLLIHFADHFNAFYKELAERRETVRITYMSDLQEYPYLQLASRSWEQDKATTRTNCGIHRDDFAFFIKDLPAKEFGSQGQLKSLIFALHLAKNAILADSSGYKPVLILDDIFDKLDDRRLNRLMHILQDDSIGQVFISDTNRERLSKDVGDAEVVEIELKHRPVEE